MSGIAEPWKGVVKPTAPFDSDGEVILRSVDKQDFHVHRLVLSLASPFFKTMFSLPQPAELDGAEDNVAISPPVVDVTETSYVVDVLLRHCYPVSKPATDHVKGIDLVLEAALKYDMGVAIQAMCSLLVSQLKPTSLKNGKTSVQIFFLACKYNLQKEAQAAARATLRFKIEDDYVPDMENIPTGYYFRLLKYRRETSSAVRKGFRDGDFKLPKICSRVDTTGGCGGKAGEPAAWWLRYQRRVLEILWDCPNSEAVYSETFVHQEVKRDAWDTEHYSNLCRICSNTIPERRTQLETFFRELYDSTANKVAFDAKFL